jgi:hypothetical protein
MDPCQASNRRVRRDGVQDSGTRGKHPRVTGETLFGPVGAVFPTGREAYKGKPRNRRNETEPGVGGGHSTSEPRENCMSGSMRGCRKRVGRCPTARLCSTLQAQGPCPCDKKHERA